MGDELTWEEFSKDNPFGLTEVQFKRIRPYISGIKSRAKKYQIGGPWSWKCHTCGATSRFGSRRRGLATQSARNHYRNKHPGEYPDFEISVDAELKKKFNGESNPVKWKTHYDKLKKGRACFGEFDESHRFCQRTCALRQHCAKHSDYIIHQDGTIERR